MRKVALLFILLALVSLAYADQGPGAAARKIKIGVSTAMTGGAATYGLDVRDALMFANEKFGRGRFEIIFEDDKCSGKDAVTIANKFINIDKVDFVVGFACSSATLSAAPLYERAKIPVIVTCASSPKIAAAGDYIFRTFPGDLHAARRLYRHVHGKHNSLGILSEETDYAQDFKNAFLEENCGKEKPLTVIEENYLPDTVDFKALLLKLRSKAPDGLFINTQAEGAFAVIVKQLKELDWNTTVYGAYFPGSPSFLSEAGGAAEGIEFVDTPSLDFLLVPEGKAVLEEYSSRYPKMRSVEAVFATTFEALRVLDQALLSGQDTRQFIYQSKFRGIFGPYSFDADGEIEGMTFMMKKIVQGKAVSLEYQPADKTPVS
jgi:branched-chain amino acid transport system substrate-binding protein